MNDANTGNGLAQKVGYYVALPSYKTSHGFPESLPVYTNKRSKPLTTGKLTEKINAAFLPDGKALRPEYFIKGSEIHGNLAHLVLGLDEKQDYNLASGLIAKEVEINGIKVVVYDIIFVTPPYQRQGHMPKLVEIAGLVEPSEKSKNRQPNVAILRTKSGYAHAQYSKISDPNIVEVKDRKSVV